MTLTFDPTDEEDCRLAQVLIDARRGTTTTQPRKRPQGRQPRQPRILDGEAEEVGRDDLSERRMAVSAEAKGMIRR